MDGKTIDTAAAAALLAGAEDILLLCHKNPDGDTLGSAGALYHALTDMGKRCAVFCADVPHSRYAFMNTGFFDGGFAPAFVVAVDVATAERVGPGGEEWAARCDLCIDHHPGNSLFAAATLLQGGYAACAQAVLDILDELGAGLTARIASCLYTGLATDTGCFKYPATSPAVHRAAARLMEAGADYVMINQVFFDTKSRRRLAVEALAMGNMQYFFEGRCAALVLERADIEALGADEADIDGVSAIPRMVEGVCVGLTLRGLATGRYKVSVRTLPGYDAAALAAAFGGGGHARAAGCEVDGPAPVALEKLLARAKELL